jgi:hypothetical protein
VARGGEAPHRARGECRIDEALRVPLLPSRRSSILPVLAFRKLLLNRSPEAGRPVREDYQAEGAEASRAGSRPVVAAAPPGALPHQARFLAEDPRRAAARAVGADTRGRRPQAVAHNRVGAVHQVLRARHRLSRDGLCKPPRFADQSVARAAQPEAAADVLQ